MRSLSKHSLTPPAPSGEDVFSFVRSKVQECFAQLQADILNAAFFPADAAVTSDGSGMATMETSFPSTSAADEASQLAQLTQPPKLFDFASDTAAVAAVLTTSLLQGDRQCSGSDCAVGGEFNATASGQFSTYADFLAFRHTLSLHVWDSMVDLIEHALPNTANTTAFAEKSAAKCATNVLSEFDWPLWAFTRQKACAACAVY